MQFRKKKVELASILHDSLCKTSSLLSICQLEKYTIQEKL